MRVSRAAATNDREEALRKCSPHAISGLGFSEQAVAVPGLHGVEKLQAQPPRVSVLPSTESFHTNPRWRRQEHESKMDFPRSQRSRRRAGPAKTFNQCMTVTWAPPPRGRGSRAGTQPVSQAFSHGHQRASRAFTQPTASPGSPSLPHCLPPQRGLTAPHTLTPSSHQQVTLQLSEFQLPWEQLADRSRASLNPHLWTWTATTTITLIIIVTRTLPMGTFPPAVRSAEPSQIPQVIL